MIFARIVNESEMNYSFFFHPSDRFSGLLRRRRCNRILDLLSILQRIAQTKSNSFGKFLNFWICAKSFGLLVANTFHF
jgi:hypothetical protein